MKSSSKNFPSNFTIAVCSAIVFLLLAQSISACSWDYLIWQNRHKNSEPYYRFIKDGKAGFIDQSGKIFIEPTLKVYGNYQDGIINGLLEKNYREYVDVKTGKEVSREYYEKNTQIYDGLLEIRAEDKFGFVNRKGKTIIEPKFLFTKHFSEGFAAVILDGPCVYYDLESPCGDGNKFPLETKLQPTDECRFGFIDKTGKLISSQNFLDIKEFSEGLAPVKTAEGWGYINRTGKIVIAPQFERAEPFSEGLALVRRDDFFGYINSSEAFIIEPQFEKAESFSNGLAPVGKYEDKINNTSFYYVNKSGKPATSDKFLLASHYFKGIAHVLVSMTFKAEKKDGEEEEIRTRTYAYINEKGEKIFVYSVED